MDLLAQMKRSPRKQKDIITDSDQVLPAEQPIPESEQSYYTDRIYPGTSVERPVITFRERREISVPSSNGLYVAEILLLQYCSYGTYPHPKNGYPGFWWFEYGIRNVGAVLESLEKRGFIQYVSARNSLSKLTVPQLKAVLIGLGLPCKGKKADLIQTLQESASDQDLEMVIQDKKYMLTSLGERELRENAYVPYMHKHCLTADNMHSTTPQFNVWEVNRQLAYRPVSEWECIVDELYSAYEKHNQQKKLENLQYVTRAAATDEEWAKKYLAQEDQLSSISEAEEAYRQDGDINTLISFWEMLWKSGGPLFVGSLLTFRLADLYIQERRYDDALDFLGNIKDEQYSDKVQRYTKKIQNLKKGIEPMK